MFAGRKQNIKNQQNPSASTQRSNQPKPKHIVFNNDEGGLQDSKPTQQPHQSNKKKSTKSAPPASVTTKKIAGMDVVIESFVSNVDTRPHTKASETAKQDDDDDTTTFTPAATDADLGDDKELLRLLRQSRKRSRQVLEPSNELSFSAEDYKKQRRVIQPSTTNKKKPPLAMSLNPTRLDQQERFGEEVIQLADEEDDEGFEDEEDAEPIIRERVDPEEGYTRKEIRYSGVKAVRKENQHRNQQRQTQISKQQSSSGTTTGRRAATSGSGLFEEEVEKW